MKKFICIVVVVCCILCCCSCGSEINVGTLEYSLPNISVAKSGTVAENDNFSLTWDNRMGNLILFEKATGNIWSSTPYDYYSGATETSEFTNSKLFSSLNIKYKTNGNSSILEKSSYDDVFSKNNAYSVKIKNGIRIIYFFDDVEISVPVEYTLTEKGMKAEILSNSISEGNQNKLYSISVLPYFTSVKNNTDSYLFVPSGSGALMYTDDNVRTERNYSENVYGDDISSNVIYNINNRQQIYIPVFAAKAETNGLMGIISDGAELAAIEANAGSKVIGFSSVFPTFYIRGTDTTILKNASNQNTVIDNLSEAIVDKDKLSVEYIVVSKEQNSYIGVANIYRDYLNEQGFLSSAEKSEILYLDILGASKIKKSFLGIAYQSLTPITTLKEAENILNDVKTFTDNDEVIASLKGFGVGGLDYSQIGGKFKIASVLGDKKDFKSLNDIEGINFIMDFDILRYTKSGCGISTFNDYARNANNTAVYSINYNIVTKDKDNSKEKPYMVMRSKIPSVGNKLLEAVKKLNLKGVSLADFGKISYGDSNENKYLAKSGTVEENSALLVSIKKNNSLVSLESPNSYAAVYSDYIYGVPSTSSKYLSIDKEVPFYQLVFKGSVALYSEPINLVSNPNKEFLRAISTGTSLYFTVGNSFNNQFTSSANSGIAGSIYDDIKSDIKDYYSRSSEFLKEVKGSKIVDYSEENGLVKTVFENGVTLYVNMNDFSVDTPNGKLEPESFIYN